MESRTKNVSRNLIFGFLNRILMILLPFISRTIIIRYLGLEYTGLGGLFTSVLSVLSLAELGFGSALVFGMYKPVSEGDTGKINAYLNTYKKCYRIIGLIILAIGLIILPFLKFFIKGDVPSDINIYVLYAIYLTQSVSSYFLFAYMQSVFVVNQRVDITSKIASCFIIGKELIQIILLILFRNYYLYSVCIPIFSILQNIIIAVLARKKYPTIKPEGQLEPSEIRNLKQNVYGLMLQKVGNVFLGSVDAVIISSFLGLKVLGIYNNYHYIISSLFGFFAVIQASLIPSVGNSIQTNSKQKNYELFKLFHFVYVAFAMFCGICVLCLANDFMFLWVGDEGVMPFKFVIVLSLYLYCYKMSDICYIFKEATGLWSKMKYVQLIAGFANLIMSILLVNWLGIYGVLVATIISLVCIFLPFFTYPVFNNYFESKKKYYEFLINQVIYMAVFCVSATVAYLIVHFIPGATYVTFAVKAISTAAITGVVLLIGLCWNKSFKEAISLAKRMILKRNTK